MATGKKSEKASTQIEEEVDYSLNDLLLRGRVSAPATTKELPSGDKVVEFRLIITRSEREGVDTLDIRSLERKDAKNCPHSRGRRMDQRFRALSIAGSGRVQAEWLSRWQIEAAEIVRL
jgi:single-strand DNA-binding protein